MTAISWSLVCSALLLLGAGRARADCAWYGLCGVDPVRGGPLPCAYSGPPRPLTDPSALRLLAKHCPSLTQGQAVETCCDRKQVEVLAKWMTLPDQIFAACPSCQVNFASIFCQMTCSASQSSFLHNDQVGSHSKVEAVTYAVSKHFAHGMFQSCKDVRLPAAKGKALGVVCGRPAEDCTVQSLLDFLGDVENGQQPFSIHFNLTDLPVSLPDGTRLTPMDTAWWRCSQSPGQGRPLCSCLDCPEQKCSLPLPILPALPCSASYKQPAKGDNLLGKKRNQKTTSAYLDQYVIVHRKGKHPDIQHEFPPPSMSNVTFSPVFDLQFLHQVLKIQETLNTLKAASSRGDVTYRDVCRHSGEGVCTSSSPLDYFQGNGTKLDKVVHDSFGFYVLANYMDHLLSCFSDPASQYDATALNMSCLSGSGRVTQPYQALCGFPFPEYRLASSLVLNLPIKNPDVSYAASVWRDKLRDFVESFQHQNASLTYFQP